MSAFIGPPLEFKVLDPRPAQGWGPARFHPGEHLMRSLNPEGVGPPVFLHGGFRARHSAALPAGVPKKSAGATSIDNRFAWSSTACWRFAGICPAVFHDWIVVGFQPVFSAMGRVPPNLLMMYSAGVIQRLYDLFDQRATIISHSQPEKFSIDAAKVRAVHVLVGSATPS